MYEDDSNIFSSLNDIYNGIIFLSLNHAKIFESILDEPVVRQLGKSHAKWLLHQTGLSARYCADFEFITFLGEF